MEKIRNEMKSENKRLEEKINKTENENGSLKENMNKIKSENESLKEKINEMKREYEEKMNNIKIDNSKKSEEIKKLNNKIITMQKDNRNEINELNSTLKVMLLDKGKKEIEINKFKNNLNKLKNEIKDVKKVLGTIQVRDLAKSFLNQFRYLLTDEDRKQIEINRPEKWIIIFKRVSITFNDYKQSTNFDAIMEIFRKSLNIIQEGDKSAHSVKANIYIEDITEVTKKNKLIIPNCNQTKLLFLSQLDIPKKLFLEGYKFLEKYFNDEMKNYKLKNIPIKNFFN
jgi:predicted nuclease with TOPRIM domain